MSLWDWAALAVFAACWLGYEPILHRLSHRSGAITTDMQAVRGAWMRAMAGREMRLVDSQLMGHAINSGSFFASANLILIAAVAGVMFGGEAALGGFSALGVQAPARLVEMKLGLVAVCLARGFLDYIWSIRQMNYCLALIGAAPEGMEAEQARAYADAAAEVLNPALSAFSRGARAYYFSLAGAGWLFGPAWLAGGAIIAFALLAWRQSRSRAAMGLRTARALLETAPSQARDAEPRDLA
ncbi:MAG TPA: DUF599 family protein [Caulobacteraceae bacterium]|nr:DUF599 family protein [Caulobacteraceae bacterium]